MSILRTALPFALLFTSCGTVPSPGATEAGGKRPSTSRLKAMGGQSIVCYNVENLFDIEDDPTINDADFLPEGSLAWTKERYTLKLEHLSEAISWSVDGTPAIIGLVEVENRTVVEDLASTKMLKEADYHIVHHDSPDERGIDVALLVHPSFTGVVKDEALKVDLLGDRTRDVLHVELALIHGQRLHIFVNHWPSRRDGEASVSKRMTAAAVVRKKVDEILDADPVALVLIMGDLNDTPSDRSIREGLGAACDKEAKADLYDLMCIDQPRSQGSYNYKGEWSYLDHMIVSEALLPKVASAKAFWDDRLLFRHPRYGRSPNKTYAGRDHKGGYSDHLPIVLRLK